jgi:hypothetical protein
MQGWQGLIIGIIVGLVLGYFTFSDDRSDKK